MKRHTTPYWSRYSPGQRVSIAVDDVLQLGTVRVVTTIGTCMIDLDDPFQRPVMRKPDEMLPEAAVLAAIELPEYAR
jgi:hypothetical protein